MKISLVQYDPEWKNKEGNLSRLEALILGSESKSNLYLLPEMFSTGFSMDVSRLSEPLDGKTLQWMREMALRTGSDIAGSAIIAEDNKYYNRFLYVKEDATYAYYDKKHLFSMADEDKFFTPGTKRVVAESNGFRINLQVCYDLRFPEWARNENDYDLLLYTANWPTPRIGQWRSLLIARAIENQCYVAAVNRVGSDPGGNIYPGVSIIIDPEGKVVAESSDNTETILTAGLDIDKVTGLRERFPVWRDK